MAVMGSVLPRFRVPPPGSISRRLAALVLAALAASFLVTAAVTTWLDLQRQAVAEAGRLTQTARVIASLSAEAVRDGDRGRAFEAVRSISQMPGLSYARVQNAAGGLVAETGSGTRLVRDTRLSDDTGVSLWSVLSTQSIEASAPVISQGQTIGTVTVFGGTPELRQRVLSTIWATLAGALAASVAGLLVALRLGRRISRPIVSLAELMRGVDYSGDYSATVDVPAEGEVADLVAGFDTLLGGIRERDARIAAHVEGLESQVAERTAELVVARDEAERANAAKSDFLAVMSHEIRTPLNGILALGDMLAQSDLPARQQRYADVIAKSGRSLLGVINDILDFSKVEAGKMELERVAFDLVEVCEDVAELFSEKALSKGLDLAVFVDPRLPSVWGDPTRLRQVISNLVNNAVKFTETGGVLIAAYRDPRDAARIMIAVRDSGPGIEADKLPRLFDAFSQADQSTTRRHGGTGLGLAICDRLVKAMNGDWRLGSTVGQGSTFAFSAPFEAAAAAAPLPAFRPEWRVALEGLSLQTGKAMDLYLQSLGVPRAAMAEAAAGFAPTPQAGAAPTVLVADSEPAAQALAGRAPDACILVKPLRRRDILALMAQMHDGETPRLAETRTADRGGAVFPGLRVLVVDDSEVNREVACEALAQLEVQTFSAGDGQDAVERLHAETFDLVLMDGSMPILDGFEATRRIRADEARLNRSRAIIVALTAHVVGAGAEAWRDCGMDGVVHKPFTVDDLRRVLFQHHPDRAREPAPVAKTTVVEASAKAAPIDAELFDPAVRADLAAMAEAGRADFVDRVHGLYRENAPLRLQEAQAALAAGDIAAVGRAAHALKSMSLSLGARAVAGESLAVENAARDAAPIALGRLASLLSATLDAVSGDAVAQAAPETLTTAFERALQAGHIHLLYQPLYDRTGAFSGKVEALVRWIDPETGPCYPDDFIPRLEAEGSIRRLTDFVLERAMLQTRDRPGLRVGVNASASEFQEEGFARRVSAMATRCGFPPSRLEIEVTETAMLDVQAARVSVEALRSAGFGVALDDFGAGYTSLHALRELKFTTLKIDRSFVERCSLDTASAAIIHAVVGVGRALGMKVVCEGVETAEQAEFLRIAGAHYLQGWHFHKPAPIEALPAGSEKVAA